MAYTLKGIAGERYRELTPDEQMAVQDAGTSAFNKYKEGAGLGWDNISAGYQNSAPQVAQEAAQRYAESLFTQKSNKLQQNEEQKSADFNTFISQNPNSTNVPTQYDPTGRYEIKNGILTDKSVAGETAKYEALVASGQYKKVPVGNGFGYIPVGGAADQNMKNIGSQMQAGQQVLGSSSTTPPVQQMNPNVGNQMSSLGGGFSLSSGNLKVGSNGENVKQLQSILGITSDGVYGPKTQQAVIEFQKANGLTPDGIVGPLTTAALNAKFGSTTGATGSTSTPITSETGTSSIGSQLGSASSLTGSSTTPTPSGVDTAYNDYEKLLKPTDEESNLQAQIQALDASKKLGIQGAEEQAIASPFITGQSAAIEKAANLKSQTLTDRLALAQAKRMASMDVAKARYGYESDKAQLAKTTATAKPTSVQEYEYAKSQGYTGTYNQYQDLDANRKARVAGAGTAGLTSAQINSTINQIAGSFDNEPVVKEYNTIARNVDTYKNLGNSATDDIQRVYTFAKVADPNSAVKEGEYNSIEKYSQALLQRAGIKVSRVFTPTGILTPEARTAMGNTLQTSLNSAKKTYDNVLNQYNQRIQQAKSGNFNSITDYSQAYNAPSNAYTVKSGDTFYKLAQANGTTVEALQQANPGVNVNALKVGQKINLPSGGGTTGVTSSGIKYTITPTP